MKQKCANSRFTSERMDIKLQIHFCFFLEDETKCLHSNCSITKIFIRLRSKQQIPDSLKGREIDPEYPRLFCFSLVILKHSSNKICIFRKFEISKYRWWPSIQRPFRFHYPLRKGLKIGNLIDFPKELSFLSLAGLKVIRRNRKLDVPKGFCLWVLLKRLVFLAFPY